MFNWGLKKEVRELVNLIREQNAENSALKEMNKLLMAQNDRLTDKLMATDYRVLRTFDHPDVPVSYPPVNPNEDESLIGEVSDSGLGSIEETSR